MKTTDDLTFLLLLGDIDETYVYETAQPWKEARRRTAFRAAACVLLVFLLGLACSFPGQVKAGFKKVLTVLEQVLGMDGDIAAYAQGVGKSITKNDLTLTLNEVVLDEEQMLVSYTASSHIPQYQEAAMREDVWINGNLVTASETYSPWDLSDEAQQLHVECYRFDKAFTQQDPAEINIHLQPELPDGTVLGEFDFEFAVSKQELAEDTISLALNQTLKITRHFSIQLKEFKLNIADTTIKAECSHLPAALGDDSIEFFLEGRDSLGNPVSYRLSQYIRPDVDFVMEKRETKIDMNADWVELQLYAQCISPDQGDIVVYADDGPLTGREREDFKLQNKTEAELIEKLADIGDPYKRFPLGEKFTINLRS